MPPEAEMIDYLQEHLPYTLRRVRSSISRCWKTKDRDEWNDSFECFISVSRNLYHFLTNDDTATYKACNYVPGGYAASKNNFTNSTHRKIIAQVVHMGKRTGANKITFGEMVEFAKWTEENLDKWLASKLPSKYSDAWNAKEAGPRPDYKSMISEYATTTTTTTSTAISITETSLSPALKQ